MNTSLSLLFAGAMVTGSFAESPSQQADAFYQKGQAAEKSGDPSAAQKYYTSALKADPNNANVRYSLGQLKIHSASIAAKGREEKFGAVMIPVFQLSEATLAESLEALSVIVAKESKNTVTPNLVIQDPKGLLIHTKISLNLKNMPATGVLKYLLDQSKAKVRYDDYAMVVTPK